MVLIILAFITSFALTFVAIPSIIHLAQMKNLMDEPGERRSHTELTPSLGGIAIFSGILFSVIMWTPFNHFGDLQYILCSFIIIFLIGVRDDIESISPYKKLAGEFLAAVILVFKANIKLTSLYGIFGIYELPIWVSVTLSLFTIIVIINAFNLIDGINTLAGSVALLICAVLGTWFFLINRLEISLISFSTAGAIVAFLKYNVTPAKIFMGDTGALLLGLVCCILTILFIETNKNLATSPYRFPAAPALAVATLIFPLFDTLRVFVLRILSGRSPFSADRNHIHHILLDLGFSHTKATITIVFISSIFVAIGYSLQTFGNLTILIVIFVIAIFLSLIAKRLLINKKMKLAE
jgi:UDP-N-acetylmuramyl pentapeptide phosphotransferase/UDP-N-acetylglucosamine-1-phosphate transferase